MKRVSKKRHVHGTHDILSQHHLNTRLVLSMNMKFLQYNNTCTSRTSSFFNKFETIESRKTLQYKNITFNMIFTKINCCLEKNTIFHLISKFIRLIKTFTSQITSSYQISNTMKLKTAIIIQILYFILNSQCISVVHIINMTSTVKYSDLFKSRTCFIINFQNWTTLTSPIKYDIWYS